MPEIYEPWKAFPLFELIHNKLVEEGFESSLGLDAWGDVAEEQVYKLQNEKHIDVYLRIYTNEKSLNALFLGTVSKADLGMGPNTTQNFT